MFGLWFGAVALAGGTVYRPLSQRAASYTQKRAAEATEQLSDIFMHLSHRTVWMAYAISPVVVGVLAWLATDKWLIGCVGMAFGVLLPRVVVLQIRRKYHNRFHNQLVDGLLLLSSSLKAGLSMNQAFTVLVEEMPPPISQEFGLMLKEIRMGVNVDEAIAHLKERMSGDDVSLFVTAVLVGRETGGDITHIFTRLVETLRERKKLKEKIKTLTFMARMQGIVMALLPFAFGYLVYQMNANYFDFFIQNPTGRVMLVMIIALQFIGGLLFFRFSRSPI